MNSSTELSASFMNFLGVAIFKMFELGDGDTSSSVDMSRNGNLGAVCCFGMPVTVVCKGCSWG